MHIDGTNAKIKHSWVKNSFELFIIRLIGLFIQNFFRFHYCTKALNNYKICSDFRTNFPNYELNAYLCFNNTV